MKTRAELIEHIRKQDRLLRKAERLINQMLNNVEPRVRELEKYLAIAPHKPLAAARRLATKNERSRT